MTSQMAHGPQSGLRGQNVTLVQVVWPSTGVLGQRVQGQWRGRRESMRLGPRFPHSSLILQGPFQVGLAGAELTFRWT